MACNVLVCGDVMQDEYWTGTTERISPEAPVPVVLVKHTETRPGGAANVALNVEAMGAEVRLLGVAGDDEAASTLLGGLGIMKRALHLSRSPTIRKLRVMSRHQQLIRLDFEQPLEFDRAELLEDFKAALPNTDVVILSDYGKGTLADAGKMIPACCGAGVPVLVDPKGRDYTNYIGATLLTPNLAEFEAVVGKCKDDADIFERGQRLLVELRIAALLVTKGERGMTLLEPMKAPLHLPAQAREVYDVTGAGDTVIACMAVMLADGADMAEAAHMANKAAGIKVGKLGTATVSRAELGL